MSVVLNLGVRLKNTALDGLRESWTLLASVPEAAASAARAVEEQCRNAGFRTGENWLGHLLFTVPAAVLPIVVALACLALCGSLALLGRAVEGVSCRACG